ncbi:hypothetical protein KCU61_g9391, partial [Aureobasidium melanogenum]
MVWDKYNRSNGGVTIDFYPNTLDNIFWSKEGIIAVGGSDHVSLFVPRLKAIASDERRWDKINLKTSFFTLDDIQLQLPLSWKNFSIGEEMSESFVHALDWSPPGLGKHKRSVLAVLTSNHVLSIWECVGKPEIATDWVRACVVNHALQAHYKEKDVQSPEESEHDHFERLRAKQRIRAFAWSPALPNSSLSGASGDFLVIEIQTPHDILEPVTPGLNLEFQVSAQEINTPWDEISGMTYVQDDNENISVQIAYHLGSGTDRITNLGLPFTAASALGSTNWQHDLLRGQRRFSDEWNLAGNVMTRAYGLCTSPFGDLVAVNVSFHPSDGVEYTTNSDEVSYLIASQSNDDLQFALAGSPSNAYELTAEALLSSLQSLAVREPEALADESFVIEQIVQALDLKDLPSGGFNQGQITEDTPVELIVRQVRQNILFNRESVHSRVTQLLKYVKADIPKTPPLDATVVLKIVTEISRLPHFVADASILSNSIMQIHCLILAKLQARAGNTDTDTSNSEEEEIERCEICHSNIPFESLRWAKCVNNHQYPRCTLTFLAIQTPGTAKACSICNAQYINEFMMPGFKDLAVIREIKEMHHLTMQALTGITGSSNPPPTPPPIPTRDSRHQDWRNSRYRSVSAPAKKVTMAPPPIDTSRISAQQTHVKTPYPFRAIHRKEFGRQFSASEPTLRSPRVHDSILTLSIRRSNPNSWLRLSTLTIPANSEFSAIKNRHHSSDRSGQEYTPQDFDDAELFRQLRRHYQSLLGPWRHFSARSLTMICVSGDASRQADSGYGWLLTPRSPRTLAYKGLNDTFSEEKLLRFFHNPSAAGKSRYAWVSWAHRLADAPAVTTPLSPPSALPSAALDTARTPTSAGATSTVNNRFSMIRRAEQHEGLEFVVSCSTNTLTTTFPPPISRLQNLNT